MSQPTLMSIVLFILTFNSFYLLKIMLDWFRETQKINRSLEELKIKVHDTHSSVDESFKNIKVDILTLQADILKNIKPNVSTRVTPNKTPPSNRKPRTEEQKLLASKQRKEWWDKKRQEQKVSVPDDFTISLPPQEVQNV